MSFTFTPRNVSSGPIVSGRLFALMHAFLQPSLRLNSAVLEGAPPLVCKGGFLRSDAATSLGFHSEVNP